MTPRPGKGLRLADANRLPAARRPHCARGIAASPSAPRADPPDHVAHLGLVRGGTRPPALPLNGASRTGGLPEPLLTTTRPAQAGDPAPHPRVFAPRPTAPTAPAPTTPRPLAGRPDDRALRGPRLQRRRGRGGRRRHARFLAHARARGRGVRDRARRLARREPHAARQLRLVAPTSWPSRRSRPTSCPAKRVAGPATRSSPWPRVSPRRWRRSSRAARCRSSSTTIPPPATPAWTSSRRLFARARPRP